MGSRLSYGDHSGADFGEHSGADSAASGSSAAKAATLEELDTEEGMRISTLFHDGSTTFAPRSAVFQNLLPGSGKHGWVGVDGTIGKACGGYQHEVSWRGQAFLRGGWMRTTLIFFNFYDKI